MSSDRFLLRPLAASTQAFNPRDKGVEVSGEPGAAHHSTNHTSLPLKPQIEVLDKPIAAPHPEPYCSQALCCDPSHSFADFRLGRQITPATLSKI